MISLLVFCDDLYHPAAAIRAGLAPLAATHFDLDWIEDPTGWNPATLGRHVVALLAKSNVRSHRDKTPWLANGTAMGLLDHVRRGGGLVVVHSGTAGYADVAPLRALLGGGLVSHPPPCVVTVEPRAGHALTVGVTGSFTVFDEHYQMALDDVHADVFLHTRSIHGVKPAGWTRTEGGGRVCVLTPGHYPEVWLHPSFQRLLANAINWVRQAS